MRRTKPFLPVPKRPKHPKVRNTIRWVLYFLCVFLAFVTANGGDTIKPLLLIPIALCISSVSGMFISGGIGILCGLLMDISTGSLLGYHSIVLFLLCMGTSLLYDRLMQQRFLNMVFFTCAAAFLVTGFDFVFRYAIWGYENVSYLYVHHALPCLLYTTISGAVCYPIFALIHRFLLPKRRRTIEKKLKPLEETI
ncbi:rod shape-determining protein MreD [uncultured Ruminococcus sp.]|uniref:rod shape-determining protein MreD n=1 Tax=uncultured Ruminococcus sp. TaxID=165186 RepID=UPI00260DA895|nr:rod shape-determining protein MreD [uncultured Ruminococcus sp.]